MKITKKPYGEEIEINLTNKVEEEWLKLLRPLFHSDYFAELLLMVKKIYEDYENIHNIEPMLPEEIFEPIRYMQPSDVKVVVLGSEPEEFSNGILFGNDQNKIFSSNKELKRFNEYCFIKNPGFIPDTSLTEWISKGILPLNVCPIRDKTTSFKFLPAFRPYMATMMYLLSKYNEDIIFVSTCGAAENILKAAKIPEDQVIYSSGYYNVRNTHGQSIFDAINEHEKLEKPIYLWK